MEARKPSGTKLSTLMFLIITAGRHRYDDDDDDDDDDNDDDNDDDAHCSM